MIRKHRATILLVGWFAAALLFSTGTMRAYSQPVRIVQTYEAPSRPNPRTQYTSAPTTQYVHSKDRLAPEAIDGSVDTRKPLKLFAVEEVIHDLKLRNTPVASILTELANKAEVNIIVDKSVVGTITGNWRDVTLNEAMDNILATAGLQARLLDKRTLFVATAPALLKLGLNRPKVKGFKLNYAHPYEVASLLSSSFFNKGATSDLVTVDKNAYNTESESESSSSGTKESDTQIFSPTKTADATKSKNSETQELNQQYKVDQGRILRGSTRLQLQEGVGFNNAATDPGSQSVRAYNEVTADYAVDQNGGGVIVVPDNKNKQVIVVGTAEDISLAEKAIKILDKRPRQVHIQASVVELTNQAIRQLGATLNLQGGGASGSLLGNSNAPTNSASSAFTGLVGTLLSSTASSIAGVSAATTSQTGFNFLTLSKAAGGRANISTFPAGLNANLNLLLQTSKAKVIANPSVVVTDDTEALITIASEVVHKVTSTTSLGVVTSNVELTKAGIFLNVLPKITDDGFITMRLRPQVSAPVGGPQTFGSSSNPVVVTLLSVRDVMSQQVRVKDGQTLVIGGLFSENEAAQLGKIPYLAEAPIVGALFRNTLKGRNRTELMLLITAKIVEDEITGLAGSAQGL